MEATAETEKPHTACESIQLSWRSAFSMCVGAFNTHCTTHTDVFNSTQNTSQQCQKVHNGRNLHGHLTCILCMTQVQWSTENYAFTCCILK